MSKKRSLLKLGRIAAVGAARRVLGGGEASDRALGEALAVELDAMKGMAMKLGQIMSYMEVPFPPELQRALGRLQSGQQGMSIEAVREVLRADFDREIEELFDAFDPDPIAAASIGQVHRAQLAGEAVAVKLRYPDVADSFDEDLARLRRIASLASLASAVDGQAIVAELGARLREECDYGMEARWQRTFGDAVQGLVDLEVPAVVDARCGPSVLTSAWCDGMRFESFCATANQGARLRAGRALARFAWTGIFTWRAMHADPHPGNFLFSPDGEVTVLDFGCVKVFETQFVDAWRRSFLALLDGSHDFAQATRDTGMMIGARFDLGAQERMVRWMLEPYSTPHFRFTPEYAARIEELGRPTSAHTRSIGIPPPFVWFARTTFGLHAVLTRLGAEGDFRDVLDPALRAEPIPLLLP